jgi:hypothetical protein
VMKRKLLGANVNCFTRTRSTSTGQPALDNHMFLII